MGYIFLVFIGLIFVNVLLVEVDSEIKEIPRKVFQTLIALDIITILIILGWLIWNLKIK